MPSASGTALKRVYSFRDAHGQWDPESQRGPSCGTSKRPPRPGRVDPRVPDVERTLPDGRAVVRVELLTKNAFSWVRRTNVGPFLLGHNLFETVILGRDPGLCDSLFRLEFIAAAPSAPMPNLGQLLFAPQPGQEVLSLQLVASGSGPLRAAFGVIEGTPGRMEVTQTGLFRKDFNGAAADAFPVENVNLRVVGQ